MKTGIILLAVSTTILGACATGYQTPQQSYEQRQKANCATGVIGGALVGGILGNQLGKGKGQDAATAVGAGAGAAAGTRLPACQ